MLDDAPFGLFFFFFISNWMTFRFLFVFFSWCDDSKREIAGVSKIVNYEHESFRSLNSLCPLVVVLLLLLLRLLLLSAKEEQRERERDEQKCCKTCNSFSIIMP